MALNIGLNVIEVDGSAPATITGAATSVGAFNIATLRGPINSPVQVTSFAQFAERFGGFDPNGLGAYLVKGFFDNGGQRAWINRVGGGATATATVKRSAADATDILRLDAGFRGTKQPGQWGSSVVVTLSPSFTAELRPGQHVGKSGAVVGSVAGFSKADSVVVTDGTHRAVVQLEAPDAVTGELKWSPEIGNAADFDDTTKIVSADFDVEVTDGVATEAFSRLTMSRNATNYAPLILNDRLRGSKLVVVTDARPNTQTTAENPGVKVATPLIGGTSTAPAVADYNGDAAAHTGWFAFDSREVNLVACDRNDAVVVRSALDYCEARGDCMFIGAVPEASVGGGTAID